MTTYGRWIRRFLAATLTAVLALTVSPSRADETITYIHWDALGSPVAASDENGNVVWRESYRPYGERIQRQPAAGPHSRWYTGHPQDEDTGLIYAGARYYDPVIGRFLAVDPVAFQADNLHSFNRYAYANNNPYGYADPDGRLPILLGPVLAFAVKEAAAEIASQLSGGATDFLSARRLGIKLLKGTGKLFTRKGTELAKGAKRGPKTDPNAPHNAKIRKIGDRIESEGGTVLAGGGRSPERLIPTPGGSKNGRRPDVLYRDSCGTLRGCNVGKTRADGSPVKREQEALDDLNGPGGLPTTYERYD